MPSVIHAGRAVSVFGENHSVALPSAPALAPPFLTTMRDVLKCSVNLRSSLPVRRSAKPCSSKALSLPKGSLQRERRDKRVNLVCLDQAPGH